MNTSSTSKSSSFAHPARRFCALLLAGVVCGLSAHAANIIKTDDSVDTLDTAAAWVGGVPPTSSDIGVWDSTIISGPNTVSLNQDTNWAGLKILNPAGTVTINAGNNLTLGASGIDMSAATTNLILGCGIGLGANQTWNITSGQTLTNNGLISGSGTLTKTGNGTLILTAAASTYTNTTTLAGGTTILGSINGGHLGTNTVTMTNGSLLVLFSGNGMDPGTGGSFTNAIFIPTNTTASIWDGARNSTWNSTLTGGGTLNLRVNYVRGDTVGNWTNFTGTMNVIGTNIQVNPHTAAGDFRINLGGNTNFTFQYTKLNLGFGVNLYQSANPPNGGTTASTTFQIVGELSGVVGSTLSGNPVSGRFAVWQVGSLNTSTTFAGVIANNVGAAGLTKVGTGTLTLSGVNTYTGPTEVRGGVLQEVTGGSAIGSVSTIVYTNSCLAVFVAPVTGGQWSGTNISFRNGSTNTFNFGGAVPSTTIAPMLAKGSLTFSNAVTINVSGGYWSLGTYPLIKYGALTNGTGFPALSLAALPARVLGYLSNDTVNTQIVLVVTNSTQPLRWATGSGTWDVATTSDWVDQTGTSTTYQEANGVGDSVLFEDTQSGSSPLTVTLNSSIVPAAVAFNSSKNFTLTGTGGIGSSSSVTKSGSGTLVIATTNTYSGGTTVGGGILNFATLANLGASNSPISFAGGTLQFASGNTADISVRKVTFASGASTIDTAGNNLSFANPVGNSGTGGLTKAGAGTLTLSGTNIYSGNTLISAGTLALASTNSWISNTPSITVSSGTILDASAVGSLILSTPAGQALSGSGTVIGSVASGTATSVSPGVSGPGTLTITTNFSLNGGTIILDMSTNLAGRDLLVVNGNLGLTNGTIQINATTVLTNGVYKLIGLSTLSGSVANITLAGYSQPNKLGTLSSANAGEIDLVVKGQSSAVATWRGFNGNAWDEELTANWTTNGSTPTVYIDGNQTIFDDTGSAASYVGLAGALLPSTVTVNNTAVTPYTFADGSGTGSGKISGSATLAKSGTGTLIIDTLNNNSGSTLISAGTVQVGDNGTDGDIGTGNITNNASLVFEQIANHTLSGVISGTGTLTQSSLSSTLTLAGNNTYTGQTIISQGTLQVGSGGANGRLGSGSVTNAGILLLNSSASFALTNGISGSQAVSGQATVIQAGSGTVTLGGTNTYEGNTYISNGVVKMASSAALPNGGTTTGWLVLDGSSTLGGTLDLSGFSETVNSLSGVAGTVNGKIINSAIGTTSSLTVNCTAATTYAGLINDNNGTGGVVQLVVNAANNALTVNNAFSTFSGGTILNAGQLNFQISGALGSGTITVGNGGILNMSQSGTPSQFPVNNIFTPTNSIATFISANLANSWSGLFSCLDASSTNIFPVTGSGSSIGGSSVFSFGNFPGTVQLDASGTIRFLGNGGTFNGGTNTRFVVNGALGSRNGMVLYLGELSGSGTLSGAGVVNGTNNTPSTYIVGNKNTSSTFDGTITGTGLTPSSLVKAGTGSLSLDGTLSYTGSTTVSNGVLALASDGTFLDTSSNLNMNASTAVIDVSVRTDGALNLGYQGPQSLNGIGTIRGNLYESANSFVNVGLGTLTVTNSATLLGAVSLQLNKTNTPSLNSELAAASFTIDPAATLVITNVGPSFSGGEHFTLFSKPVSFTSGLITLPALTSPLTWNNRLAIDGTIAIVGSLVNTSSTNIIAVVSGSNLTLSWPSDHTGWRLQSQTNSLAVGLRTNWVDVAGAATTNQVIVPLNSANGAVFYRMVYP